MFRHIVQTPSTSKNLRQLHVACSFLKGYNPEEHQLPERYRRQVEESKRTLQWRTPIGDRPGDWNSKLKSFADMEQTGDYITMMQQPMDFRPSAIKNWWKKKKERVERHMQQYVSERHEVLGNELAAAHFIIFRGGSVKFLHEKDWKKSDEDGEYNIPTKFHPAWKVEAIRCDNMILYWEGLENIRCLENLKFLSFHNVKTFDDWCLDRVSGSEFPKLEILDISGTNTTERGLHCLYRIPTLKLLIVDDPKKSLEYELRCALLEASNPTLRIVRSEDIHGPQKDENDKS